MQHKPLTNRWIIGSHNDSTSIGTDLAEGLCGGDALSLIGGPKAINYRLLPKYGVEAAHVGTWWTSQAQKPEKDNKAPRAGVPTTWAALSHNVVQKKITT